MRFIINKLLVPLIAVTAIIIALHVWNLHNQTKIRLDQIVQLSTEINNSKKNITNVDSLRNVIIQLEFEKQTYTSNLDMMSNWFILFETILFGIFFLVGYGIFDNKITDSYEKSKTAYKDIHERYVQFEKEFKDLKYDVFDSVADVSVLNSIHAFKEMEAGNSKLFPDVIVSTMKGLEYTQKSYLIHPEKFKNRDITKLGFNSLILVLTHLTPDQKKYFVAYFNKREDDLLSIMKSVDFIYANGTNDAKNQCAKFRQLFNQILEV